MKKRAVICSPALHCSTIGAAGLNFSVRNGKRWNPGAIATLYGSALDKGASLTRHTTPASEECGGQAPRNTGRLGARRRGMRPAPRGEAFGQLVALGFGVAAFTPAPYQRRNLRRPS